MCSVASFLYVRGPTVSDYVSAVFKDAEQSWQEKRKKETYWLSLKVSAAVGGEIVVE